MYRIGLLLYGIVLFSEAVCDFRKKEIPLLIFVFALFPMGLICAATDDISWKLRLSGAAIGLVFFLLSRLCPGSVGPGDAVGIGQLGFTFGALRLAVCLGISLFLLMVVSAVMFLFRRVGRKDTLPFFPFLFTGFIGMLLAGTGA